MSDRPKLRAALSVSLLANVRLMRDWFIAAHKGMIGTGPNILSRDDPMAELLEMQTRLARVNAQLRAIGWIVPELQCRVDPLGFVVVNGEFLQKAEKWLVTPMPLDGALQ